VKEIAAQHGLLATFMAKPWFTESGSSFHVHHSLSKDGKNAFSDDGRLSKLGRSYLGGLQRHVADLALLSAPNPNSMKRRQANTFCPTNNTWGMDNRTVAIRVIEGDPGAVRIEQRDGSADANPYLLIGGQIAAGLAGVTEGLAPSPITTGNGYLSTDAEALPSNIPDAIIRFESSTLVKDLIHPMLIETLVGQARREQDFMMNSGEDDPMSTVTQVERDRYMPGF
jgi:glutamine synthetase